MALGEQSAAPPGQHNALAKKSQFPAISTIADGCVKYQQLQKMSIAAKIISRFVPTRHSEDIPMNNNHTTKDILAYSRGLQTGTRCPRWGLQAFRNPATEGKKFQISRSSYCHWQFRNRLTQHIRALFPVLQLLATRQSTQTGMDSFRCLVLKIHTIKSWFIGLHRQPPSENE